MANTIDADDPLTGWTVQQGKQPNASTLTGNKLARWQYQHAPGQVILASQLPNKAVQSAAGLPYEQYDRFLVVANDATTQANVRSGVVDATTHMFPTWALSTTRSVTDGATTASSTTVTSATANFTSAVDVGATISGGSIPAGATIVSVTSATTVVISAAATATASAVSLTIVTKAY